MILFTDKDNFNVKNHNEKLMLRILIAYITLLLYSFNLLFTY